MSDQSERVQAVFAAILKRPVGAEEEITREDEKGWDSLKQMELIFAFEEEFGIEFTENDMAGLDSRAKFTARIMELL